MKFEQVKEELLKAGLLDEEKSVVFATAKSLPRGEYGLVILALNDRFLTILDTDFSQRIGDILYEIPLRQITAIKSSDFVFNPYLKFNYDEFRYYFARFGDAKNFINALKTRTAA